MLQSILGPCIWSSCMTLGGLAIYHNDVGQGMFFVAVGFVAWGLLEREATPAPQPAHTALHQALIDALAEMEGRKWSFRDCASSATAALTTLLAPAEKNNERYLLRSLGELLDDATVCSFLANRHVPGKGTVLTHTQRDKVRAAWIIILRESHAMCKRQQQSKTQPEWVCSLANRLEAVQEYVL